MQEGIAIALHLDLTKLRKNKHNLWTFGADFDFGDHQLSAINGKLDGDFPERVSWRKKYMASNEEELKIAQGYLNGFNTDLLNWAYNEGEDSTSEEKVEVLLRSDMSSERIEQIGQVYLDVYELVFPSVEHYATLLESNPFEKTLAKLLITGARHNSTAFSNSLLECVVQGESDRGEYGSGFYVSVLDESKEPIRLGNYCLLRPELNAIKLVKGDKVLVAVPPKHGGYTEISDGIAIEKL